MATKLKSFSVISPSIFTPKLNPRPLLRCVLTIRVNSGSCTISFSRTNKNSTPSPTKKVVLQLETPTTDLTIRTSAALSLDSSPDLNRSNSISALQHSARKARSRQAMSDLSSLGSDEVLGPGLSKSLQDKITSIKQETNKNPVPAPIEHDDDIPAPPSSLPQTQIWDLLAQDSVCH